MASRSALVLCLAVWLGCVGLPGPTPRASDALAAGDDRFRASQRLVLEGLDADTLGNTARARSRYERAIQADSSNPWAYLALARHHLALGEAPLARRHAERAASLFEASELGSPGALLHCDGIRGAALALEGRSHEARPLLDAASRGLPRVWADGELSASELR